MHGQQNIICTNFDYLPLAQSNHHSKRMRSITLSCVPFMALQHFPHYLINDTISIEEDMKHVFDIVYKSFQKCFFT